MTLAEAYKILTHVSILSCTGDTTFVTANTGSLSNCTYTWLSIPSGAYLSSANSSITGLSFQNSGTHTIILNVTSANVTSSYQNSLTSVPLPTITLTQNSLTTCIASNFPLFSKPVHFTATGGTSYTWNPPPLPSMTGNPNGPTNDVRPSSTTCFSVTGQNSNGCKALASVCVSVIPRFSITVPPDTFMCANILDSPGYILALTAGNPSSPVFGLSSSYSYSWTQPPMGSILTSVFAASVIVAPLTITTYTVEMLDSLHCISLPSMITVDVLYCTGLKNGRSDGIIVEVFPNPFKETLAVLVENSATKNQKIIIYDSFGQIVFIASDLSSKNVLYLEDLPPGIYYLKIQDSFSKKIIKN